MRAHRGNINELTRRNRKDLTDRSGKILYNKLTHNQISVHTKSAVSGAKNNKGTKMCKESKENTASMKV